MIAAFLTAIVAISVMPMQESAIRSVGIADYRGRAEGILQSQLEYSEFRIMNSANVIIAGAPITNTVTVSGVAGVTGDVTYTVITTTTAYPTYWVVNVLVTWPGNATGITSSIMATRQSLGIN